MWRRRDQHGESGRETKTRLFGLTSIGSATKKMNESKRMNSIRPKIAPTFMIKTSGSTSFWQLKKIQTYVAMVYNLMTPNKKNSPAKKATPSSANRMDFPVFSYSIVAGLDSGFLGKDNKRNAIFAEEFISDLTLSPSLQYPCPRNSGFLSSDRLSQKEGRDETGIQNCQDLSRIASFENKECDCGLPDNIQVGVRAKNHGRFSYL